jgi:hypothetical protein
MQRPHDRAQDEPQGQSPPAAHSDTQNPSPPQMLPAAQSEFD